nr:MAG TPA: hypothetical protein [Caudoviricetes sp.]
MCERTYNLRYGGRCQNGLRLVIAVLIPFEC